MIGHLAVHRKIKNIRRDLKITFECTLHSALARGSSRRLGGIEPQKGVPERSR